MLEIRLNLLQNPHAFRHGECQPSEAIEHRRYGLSEGSAPKTSREARALGILPPADFTRM